MSTLNVVHMQRQLVSFPGFIGAQGRVWEWGEVPITWCSRDGSLFWNSSGSLWGVGAV